MVKKIETPQSSCTEKMEYYNRGLLVTFKTGAKYLYLNVPLQLWNELVQIANTEFCSVGAAFTVKVKNAGYKFHRVS